MKSRDTNIASLLVAVAVAALATASPGGRPDPTKPVPWMPGTTSALHAPGA